MEVFKVHHASDEKIILKSDRQIDTLFKEISNDQNFLVQWNEKDGSHTKLFLGDGLLSRLKDGRMVIEAIKKDGETNETEEEEQ